MGETVEKEGGQLGQVSEAIARALRIVEAHPSMDVGSVCVDVAASSVIVQIDVHLSLPNAWMANGQSPNGVLSIETVHIIFPPNYPLEPPVVNLRPDFDRSVAHIQPGNPSSPAVPCLFDGNLGELLQRDGLATLLNQLVHWLESAAKAQLIDPEQGWEPVRRDSLPNTLIADADCLKKLVDRNGGHAFFRFNYCRINKGPDHFFYGIAGTEKVSFNTKTIEGMIGVIQVSEKRLVNRGHSLALFAWPGKHSDGSPIIAEEYRPETVTDLGGLFQRADSYGCGQTLREGLKWLEQCSNVLKPSWPFPLAIILCARRPFHVIHQTSDIEFCPYIIEAASPKLFPLGDQTTVTPTAHRDSISIDLLRRMSGDNEVSTPLSWVLLGCGSLGSKIAIHAARAGRGPSVVIDSGILNPHNAARHALIPNAGEASLSWLDHKAQALAVAIRGFGQSIQVINERFEKLAVSLGSLTGVIPKSAWGLVNATASLTVRETLGSLPRAIAFPRVIETSLFAAGKVGIVSVEGPGRNPDTIDLVTEAYSLMREDNNLRRLVFDVASSTTRVPVGEGCGSFTMAMSDALVSMHAAPMSEMLMGMQRSGMPSTGSLAISQLSVDGISLTWSRHEISPVMVVQVERAPDWTVRISARALSKIEEEVGRCPTVETGGILIGRISEAAKTFYVSDVLTAPEDSIRSASLFTLGIRGVRRRLSAYSKSSNFSLFCLGTWHSHLRPSGPSATDEQTAATIALAQLAPSILIIHTPGGFRAILADSISQMGSFQANEAEPSTELMQE